MVNHSYTCLYGLCKGLIFMFLYFENYYPSGSVAAIVHYRKIARLMHTIVYHSCEYRKCYTDCHTVHLELKFWLQDVVQV